MEKKKPSPRLSPQSPQQQLRRRTLLRPLHRPNPPRKKTKAAGELRALFVIFSASNLPKSLLLALLVLLCGSASCERPRASVETVLQDPPDPFPALRAFEAERRAQTNFTTLPSSDHVLGPDPYAITSVGRNFAAILRGRDELVVLDADLKELQRLPTPRSPTGVTASSDGKTVFVVGERDAFVARYSVLDTAPFLQPAGRYDLPDVRTLRDVTFGPEGVLYVVDEDRGHLISLVPQPSEAAAPDAVLSARRVDLKLGGNPIQVSRAGKFILTNCVSAHSVVVHAVDADGAIRVDTPEVRISHDGPIWSFSAVASGDGLYVLVGGVEDHPLDRRGGFFGYIDSFVTLYKVQAGKAERRSTINVSEFGVITPKAVLLEEVEGGKHRIFVTGYGGEKLVQFTLGDTDKQPTDVRTDPLAAGSRAFVKNADGGFVVANPLLDALVVLNADGTTKKIVRVQDSEKESEARRTLRLGEALFFTNLMAPNNATEDAHSRFSCETCHFEGYVDGRIHHTGRGEVRVVTKPLLGLFNNRPHFSRALDPDMSSVAHNEFRVAGAGNDVSPWFTLEPATHPTLVAMEPPFQKPLEPLELRKALMTFLMAFSPRTNPAIEGKTAFSDIELQGANVFRDKCESCHQARTSTDEPASRVSFEQWEKLVLSSSGPIVWAMNEYRQTGVVPYVHERGARVPSLRRLYKKRPYLTSGAAKDVHGVLERIGFTEQNDFYHDGASASAKRLNAREMQALEAFLALL